MYASIVVLMLIDTHEPSLPPPQPTPGGTWHPSGLRPVLFVAAGLGLALVSGMFLPVPAYVLILAACVLIARGLGATVRGNPSSLNDFRQ